MSQLALVVDDVRRRQWLENQLVKAAHYVLLSCDAPHLEILYPSLEEAPQAWLILLPERQVERALDYIGSVSSAPTLVLNEWPEDRDAHTRWLNQLMTKLNATLLPTLSPPVILPPQQIWLLAASLGGPEAVTEFLAALPGDLPVAFVYVQHIEEAFDQALVTHLNRQTPFEAFKFDGETRLGVGRILIVAPEKRPRFLPFQRVIPASKPWLGKFRPGIDEVAADLARLYRERLGLIVFSGTCNDGERAAVLVNRVGGQVWSQSPESCLIATMPEAANRTGVVGVSGTPRELAATLASRLRNAAKS
ncbi:chemotaxis protein CheB [Litorivivens sp.]|uniref:chemotaxis protein CheB n=2 Tax=Litorivivens sp. TaxID=2020868 RepID=UPI0035646221